MVSVTGEDQDERPKAAALPLAGFPFDKLTLQPFSEALIVV
jgi:hypothetical protein